jgi:hypothetical protein
LAAIVARIARLQDHAATFGGADPTRNCCERAVAEKRPGRVYSPAGY